MKCYFCQEDCQKYNNSDVNYICFRCDNGNPDLKVITSYFNLKSICTKAHLMFKIHHIRLELEDNCTTVDGEMILPGFPLNPQNCIEKLKLYYLFS